MYAGGRIQVMLINEGPLIYDIQFSHNLTNDQYFVRQLHSCAGCLHPNDQVNKVKTY